jgi:hypothetical protein
MSTTTTEDRDRLQQAAADEFEAYVGSKVAEAHQAAEDVYNTILKGSEDEGQMALARAYVCQAFNLTHFSPTVSTDLF